MKIVIKIPDDLARTAETANLDIQALATDGAIKLLSQMVGLMAPDDALSARLKRIAAHKASLPSQHWRGCPPGCGH